MTVYDVIKNKRDGKKLSRDEIYYLINSYCNGRAEDYHMSAFAMAVFLRGMDNEETAFLCDAMADSGEKLDLSVFGELSVDKHSTGGVGDKTTLVVAPIAASLGCKVAKMSGRGLGHTGGTIDKLESIPGMRTSLSSEEFIKQVSDIGLAVISPDRNLAPADKKLYALRDVTATVDSIPLIASSIMSKKIAAGSKNIVLDVKYGSGAFMKDLSSAETLASEMIETGRRCDRNCAALLTDMDMPLGYSVGNALEVKEAISVLSGKYCPRFSEVCIEISSLMISLAQQISVEDSRAKVKKVLSDGTALNKFAEWIEHQGGNSDIINNESLLPKAEITYEIFTEQEGYISYINAEEIGFIAMYLGAGRSSVNDYIDMSAGIVFCKTVGDKIFKGDPIAYIHTNNIEKVNEAKKRILDAVKITEEKPQNKDVIGKILGI